VNQRSGRTGGWSSSQHWVEEGEGDPAVWHDTWRRVGGWCGRRTVVWLLRSPAPMGAGWATWRACRENPRGAHVGRGEEGCWADLEEQ
jgi:hypothetical protein